MTELYPVGENESNKAVIRCVEYGHVIDFEISLCSLVKPAQGGRGCSIHVITVGSDGIGSVYHIKPLLVDGQRGRTEQSSSSRKSPRVNTVSKVQPRTH